MTFGKAFFERICGYYPKIEFLLERAKFYSGTFALYEALHEFRNNDKEAFESGMENMCNSSHILKKTQELKA